MFVLCPVVDGKLSRSGQTLSAKLDYPLSALTPDETACCFKQVFCIAAVPVIQYLRGWVDVMDQQKTPA